MSDITSQKEWFSILANVIDTPIYTARNRILNGQFKPGMQAPLGRLLPPIDHRTIGSNELLIELDAKSFAQNSKYALQITGYLNSQEIPHYVFWSGNKSLHIHIFLHIDIKDPEKQKIVREAAKKGCNLYRDIRLRLCTEIVEQSGLNKEIIGIGKIIDLAKLNWDDIGGKNTLIRCCGGANKKIDKVDSSIIKGGYKTYLEAIPNQKPKENSFEDVEYPKVIDVWEIDETLVTQVAHDFIEASKKKKKSERQESYDGKYITLPCVQQIMEGMPRGKRSYGALAIALATRIDGQNIDEAEKLLQVYVNNCSQDPIDKFEFKEGKEWVDWIYKQPVPFWNCGKCKQLGVCDIQDCALHKELYKEEIEFFEKNEPLELVKKALDYMVVGEDELKMQLFILMLTKDLNPEWSIMLDGSASSGKTFVMKAVASLFGELDEEYFVYSRITKSVLNYAQVYAEKWDGKIVIIEELQGMKEAVEQLRIIISEGRLNLISTVEEKAEDGTKHHTAQDNVVNFNTLFVTCNAEDADEGDQLASRSWILNTDQSLEQTKAIVKARLKRHTHKVKDLPPEIHIIRGALRTLKKYPYQRILFPFGEDIAPYIPIKSVRARRDVDKITRAIKTSAYLHQNNRLKFEFEGEEYLVADWRDVFWIFHYCGGAINASAQGVGARDLDYYEQIEQARGNYVVEFTIADVQRWLAAGRGTASKIMANLSRAGFYENDQPQGVKAKYKKTAVSPAYLGNITCESCDKAKIQGLWLGKWVKEAFPTCLILKNLSREIFEFELEFMETLMKGGR